MPAELRTEVAAVLEQMCSPAGDLRIGSPRSTSHLYDASPHRLRTWQEIFDQILADGSAPREGRAVVVTAGPPGAGKSTHLHATLAGELGLWRRLDPDLLKEMLIRRAVADGIYEDLLRRPLVDGRPLMPLELSGLVHVESVQMVADLRRICMQRGENVVLEGTLGWEPQIDVHLGEVAQYGYDDLGVLVVDVPPESARERALERWWAGRTDSSSELGGRFVPKSAIDACYKAGGISVCRVNAEEMVRRARRMEGLRVRTIEPGEQGPSLRAVSDK